MNEYFKLFSVVLGYYRVKYNDELYGYIIDAFAASDENRKAVHEFNRAQVIIILLAINHKINVHCLFSVGG